MVTVQHLVHFLGREEQILAAFVRHHEAETIGMAFHPAADEIELGRQAPFVAPVLHQLAVARHGAEATLEQRQFVLADAQQACKRAE